MQGTKACDTVLSTPTRYARERWHTDGIAEIDVISRQWSLAFRSALGFQDPEEDQNNSQGQKRRVVVWRLLGCQAGRYQQPSSVLIRGWTQVGICILQPPEVSGFRQLPETFQMG